MAGAGEQWVDAGSIDQIPAGHVRLVTAGDLRIAVCNVDGQLYAIEDVCTHDGGPLDQGQLEGDEIECPRHGGRFNVRTGEATQMPAVMPVAKFPLRIEGRDILVRTIPEE